MSDHDTRHRIMLHVLKNGPVSATDISDEFGLSAAGVRRHLDNIVAEGLAEIVSVSKSGQRGRPAKLFRLTDAGRARFGHDYDTLALLALRALKQAGGEAAVENFAAERIHDILGDIAETPENASSPADVTGRDSEAHNHACGCASNEGTVAVQGNPTAPDGAAVDESDDLVARAHAIANALTEHGYAATVGNAAGGVQICRHHCPIQDVAHEFPELCAAEHRVVAELLGQHTQPLATIADGNGICTTYIPLTTIHPSPTKES